MPAQRATAAQSRSHGRLRRRPHYESRAEAEAVDNPSLRLRLSSIIDVRASDDELRVDHFCRPFFLGIFPGVGQARPLLVSHSPIVLREVEHDAVRGRPGPRCGTYISFKYG